MRSRIVSTPPKRAVGVNISREKSDRLKEIIKAAGAEYEDLPDNCGDRQVGDLCGISGFSKGSGNVKTEREMLIFSGMSGSELNLIINEMRNAGCRVDLKAAATPSNLKWTVNALVEELSREHEALKNYRKQGQENNENGYAEI